MVQFQLVSDYTPKGDQPGAIQQLLEGLRQKKKFQTLLGATGTGKTYAMANVIAQINLPTLVMAPNKLLAAQLFQEFKDLFPNNSVHYYISYFDYYQPEAYIPTSGMYIEKDSDVNDEIMKYRLASTHALMTRQDVIIVASVSCIYGIGNPKEWAQKSLILEPGMHIDRKELIKKLIEIQFERNNVDFHRGTIRIHGDVIDIFPGYLDWYYRVNFFGDEIESIYEMDPVTNQRLAVTPNLKIFPTREYITVEEVIEKVIPEIKKELEERVAWFKAQGRWAEAQRLEEKTNYDLELLRETGFCKGIENYSRFLDQRKPGEPPACLYDYFPKEFLLIMDESHIGVPQISGMIGGDISRKKSLVDYGFRLPSAYDNRPLKFEEWEQKLCYVIFTSATPGSYELEHSGNVWADMVIRPTGLVDPSVEVRPVEHQIDDLLGEIRIEIKKGNRVLVTTLTKRMAESIAEYYSDAGIKIKYLHSDIDTVERMDLIRELRMGEIDVLIGINLLREGLDIPEVGFVAILDADKEGFLRDTRSLIQTIGRASRNVDGRVIIYADNRTQSIENAIKETYRRRDKQIAYNKLHNITPQTIKKRIQESLAEPVTEDESEESFDTVLRKTVQKTESVDDLLKMLEDAMYEASKNLEFEKAAFLRDKIKGIREGKENPESIVHKAKELSNLKNTSNLKPANEDGMVLDSELQEGEPGNTYIPKDYSEIQLLGTTRKRGQQKTREKFASKKTHRNK